MKINIKVVSLMALVSISFVAVYAIVNNGTERADKRERLKQLDSQYAMEQNKLSQMPNHTAEEIEATVQQGKKIKALDSERETLRREIDPDDSAHFLNQLDSYILGMMDSVHELKDRATREQNNEYLNQAEALEQKIKKFQQERELYLQNQKTIKQLRAELDLPVD